MRQHQSVYLPLILDLLFFVTVAVVWYALAFGQCAPNDLNCMNLP